MPSGSNRPPAWGGSIFEPFDVPSGGHCILRRLDPMDLLERGILQQTDLLSGTVRKQIEAAKASPSRQQEIATDFMAEQLEKGNFKDLGNVIALTLVAAVEEPKLEIPPENYADRVDGVFYTDTVPFDDRIAIFSHVMKGINKGRAFRGEPTSDVGDVEPVSSVSLPAE